MIGDRAACLKLLIDAGANLEATDALSKTPLHEAAANGYPELLSLLIQSGANVNATNINGYTPLHEATSIPLAPGYAGSAVDCVDLLLKAGAAVNVEEINRWTPLDIAINRRHYRMWPLLLRAGAEVPRYYSPMPNQYLLRVQGAGGFNKYAQAHLARLTNTFEPKLPLLPPELVRHVVSFWLHAGYY